MGFLLNMHDNSRQISSTVLHNIESQNLVKRSINSHISPPGSARAVILDERCALQHDSVSAAEVEARIAKKVALLDQPVREFTTKPGNPQVNNIFHIHLFIFLHIIWLLFSFFRCEMDKTYSISSFFFFKQVLELRRKTIHSIQIFVVFKIKCLKF